MSEEGGSRHTDRSAGRHGGVSRWSVWCSFMLPAAYGWVGGGWQVGEVRDTSQLLRLPSLTTRRRSRRPHGGASGLGGRGEQQPGLAWLH